MNDVELHTLAELVDELQLTEHEVLTVVGAIAIEELYMEKVKENANISLQVPKLRKGRR